MNIYSVYNCKLLLSIGKSSGSKCLLARCASSGLGLWDKDLDNDIKHKIEDHWRDKINQNVDSAVSSSTEKFYVLSMFPYPSGALHMGHVRVYSISDTVARFYRMTGKRVIHPIGWDAFGLPAENAAIERQLDPAEWTKQNIKNMRSQLDNLGCSFDWDRELATCEPEYYRWTQELFLKLYERDLIYKKESFVNWDPVDQTVLADEQVDANNLSWRSGAKVEKKLLNQWFVRTTVFAKSLMEGLSDPVLKEWRDIIKLQKHWIGECDGTNFDFELLSNVPGYPKTLNLWTSKPELIEKAKFIALAPRSILTRVEGYEKSKEPAIRLNARVLNPFTKEELPIFVTDSVEYSMFRDNYLGIPCDSEVDAEFCNSIGIKFESQCELSNEERERKRSEILETAKKWQIGGYPVSIKMRDWLISRQRYWGTPIPVVHCSACGIQPVPRDQLPVELPKIKRSSENSNVTLRNAGEWLETSCPKCGGTATRETDTMDTFVDSSWYFMRYIDPRNKLEMFSKEKANEYLPVDLYIGGKEHAVLHLYYARFVNHFLHSEGLLPTREPFKQLLVQGMVMGMTYRVKGSGKYLREHEVEKVGQNYVEKETGNPVVAAWEKMSKSKYNGVDPRDMFDEYGTDTTRLIILANFAPTSSRHWSTETFPGVLNWQKRMWLSVRDFIKHRNSLTAEELRDIPTEEKFIEENDYMWKSRNYAVKGVTFNISESQQLSVGISRIQALTSSVRRVSPKCIARSREYERALAAQIIMLAPMAPHFASELWTGFCSAPHRLNDNDEIQWDKDVLLQRWPQVDMHYEMDLIVFVNSEEIKRIKVPRYQLDKMTADEAEQLVMANSDVQNYMRNRNLLRLRFLPRKDYDAHVRITTRREKRVEVSQEITL